MSYSPGYTPCPQCKAEGDSNFMVQRHTVLNKWILFCLSCQHWRDAQ